MLLKDKIAVIAGGTGGVGEGIVRAFLQAGATVIIPSRSELKLERLKEYVSDIKKGTLVPVAGSVNNEENSQVLSAFLIKEFKNIDIAIASLGGWFQGYPLYSTPVEKWNKIIHDNLTSHFLAIKTFIPLLHPQSGCYVHINGFSAEQPYPMAGTVAMTAAAQKSLVLTLAEEVRTTGIRVYEFILGPIKTRDRLKRGHGQPDWYFAEEIGDAIIGEITRDHQEKIVHYLMSKIEEST